MGLEPRASRWSAEASVKKACKSEEVLVRSWHWIHVDADWNYSQECW
ncbi:hypothetical protein SP19_101 [Salmonella phage 19]|nr:hypothetical protein SP19_101 [Salmonella phage 19]